MPTKLRPRYVKCDPDLLRAAEVLVHGAATVIRLEDGTKHITFRAVWTQPPDKRLVECNCAGIEGTHFTTSPHAALVTPSGAERIGPHALRVTLPPLPSLLEPLPADPDSSPRERAQRDLRPRRARKQKPISG